MAKASAAFFAAATGEIPITGGSISTTEMTCAMGKSAIRCDCSPRLTAKAMNAEELAALLLDVGEQSRAAMGVARQRLSAQGVFFSDGHATDRVVALIDSALRLQTR